MAFNRGIDADLTKIYNGQYGLPFNNGETYTNPNNQTFTFVELTTSETLDLIPGFAIQDSVGGARNLDTGTSGGGKVRGVWVGDGKNACVAASGAAKKGVWVQSGGLVAGDVWTRLSSLNGSTGSATPFSGLSGAQAFTGLGASTVQTGFTSLSYNVLIEQGLIIDASGDSAVYSAVNAGGTCTNASTAIVTGVSQTAANILVLQSNPGEATSQAILDGYTIGQYLNIGDKDLTAGSDGDKNAITIKLIKAIADQDGNRVGVVGTFQSATDATAADQTKLYFGTPTQTTAGSGDYVQVDGVGAGGTTAAAASRDEEYTDMTSANTGLDFYVAALGTTARLTL